MAALHRHRHTHLPALLVKAAEEREIASAEGLLEQVSALQTQSLRILTRAEKAGDLRAALMAIREAARCLELQAKMIAAAMSVGRTPDLTLETALEVVDREIARLETHGC